MIKRILSGFLLLSALLVISGCATTATGADFAKVENANPEGASVVYVYRPKGGFWTGMNTVLYLLINDETVGPIKTGAYLTAQVQAGNNRFVVKGSTLDGLLGGIPKLNTTVPIPAGENVYLKIGASRSVIGSTNTLSIESVPEEIALEEMKTLKQSN